MRGEKITDFHTGIDITNLGQVTCIGDGKVVECVKNIKGYDTVNKSGNYIMVYHGKNIEGKKIYTKYNHLDYGSVKLNIGDEVKTGAIMGTNNIKTTGYSTGLHLHFSVKENSSYVDPKPYLKAVKLLPNVIDETSDSEETIYIVKKGDTLSGIAKKYNITYQELARYNNITNPNLIYPNQKIKIPSKTSNNIITYIVKKGDTLWGIALKYLGSGNRYKEIADYNNILNPNKLKIGQTIKIVTN